MDGLSKLEHAVYGAAQVLKRPRCRQILRGLDPTFGGLNGVLWLRFCGLLTGSLGSLFSLKPHYHYHYQIVLVTEYVIQHAQISTKDYDWLPYLGDLIVYFTQLTEDTVCGHHGYLVMQIVVEGFKRETAFVITRLHRLAEMTVPH